MGNKSGKCQHTPLDQFDDPCPECPPWPEGKPFSFGDPGLMKPLEPIPEEPSNSKEQADISSKEQEH